MGIDTDSPNAIRLNDLIVCGRAEATQGYHAEHGVVRGVSKINECNRDFSPTVEAPSGKISVHSISSNEVRASK